MAALFQEIQNTTDKTGTIKPKAYTAFTAERRAAIGKHTTENGNATAVTHEKVTSHFALLPSFAPCNDKIINGCGFSHAVALRINKLDINLYRG